MSLIVHAEEKFAITGQADPRLASFDQMMIRFLEEHQVPGAAVAITRKGKLVYARGFGIADRERGTAVQPNSLFRIASISKPITAVAVLQLIHQGKLAFDDKIFSCLELEKSIDGTLASDSRLKQVTIRQLLEHRGGWDRDVSFDPMFRPVLIAETLGRKPPAGPADIIEYMLSQRLDFSPGARYAYSNFGYCLLGRAIEKRTGIPYGEYVLKNVLSPLGIRDMRLGSTLETAPGEVHYYDEKDRMGKAVVGPHFGEQVPLPYGAWYLEAMDSHGGWIASAVDLVRFAAAFDDPEHCPILNDAMITEMYKNPEMAGDTAETKPTFYACGWSVRPIGEDGKYNAWHNGALAGTSTILVRRHDGLNWAVLFNSRNDPEGRALATEVDPRMHRAAATVLEWPTTDQFPEFLSVTTPQ
ncbi:MAG: serine hydrolase domain-containing protein [Planctomycetota bacterium]